MHRTAGFALLLGLALVAIANRIYFNTACKLANLALADGPLVERGAQPTGCEKA
jgi:hypothetical protein